MINEEKHTNPQANNNIFGTISNVYIFVFKQYLVKEAEKAVSYKITILIYSLSLYY